MGTHFCAGGRQAYEAGLQRQFAALVEALRERLTASCDNAERLTIESEISKVEAEHQQKLREIPGLLF